MLDPDRLSAQLDRVSTDACARARRQHIRPLRGIRGVPAADVTRVMVQTWKATPPTLPDDADALHQLFCTAFEDGLVAIGLLSALAPDAPQEALDLCERWLAMADDPETADALGWLVLGPALLAAGEPVEAALRVELGENPTRRRAAVLAAMALLPEPVSGPVAGALRERMGQRRLAFVAEPQSDAVAAVLDRASRDTDPHVRKAMVRLARCWGEHDPEACERWLTAQKGGVWKLLRDEAQRGISRGRRREPGA